MAFVEAAEFVILEVTNYKQVTGRCLAKPLIIRRNPRAPKMPLLGAVVIAHSDAAKTARVPGDNLVLALYASLTTWPAIGPGNAHFLKDL